MKNIIDYIQKYGDLTFEEKEFNKVDALALSQFSYLKLQGKVPNVGTMLPPVTLKSIALSDGVEDLFADERYRKNNKALFDAMAASRRFADVRLNHYIDLISDKWEMQFSAVTAYLADGLTHVLFRGTDETMIGWKEDFNMSYLPETGGQREAVAYLNRVGKKLRRPIRVGGHSKGGNFAVYASAFCDKSVRDRIIAVYSNDAPGFRREVTESEEYRAVIEKVKSIVPESSVIGLLLSSEAAHKYMVASSVKGMLQHDGISWEVSRDRFTHLPELSPESLRVQAQIHDWLDHLDIATRRRFVDALFDTLSASGAETVSDIMSGALKALSASGNALKAMDKDMRDRVVDFIRLLIQVWSEMESESRREQTQKALGAFTQSLQYFQKNLVMPGLQKLQQNAGTRRGLLLKKAGKAGDVEPDAGTDAPDGQKA